MSKQEWCIETAMKRVMVDGQGKLSVKSDFARSAMSVDQNTLSQCLLRLAHLIRDKGDQYLPIFERIQDELDKTRQMTHLKDLAIQLAEQDSGVQGPS